jgi:vitamin B12 transporter
LKTNFKIKILLLVFLFPIFLFAQTDTTKTLPEYELTSKRLNRYALGQNRVDFDSLTLSRYSFQNLADLLQNETPLSIKAYGVGSATVSMRGTGSSHTAVVWNGFNIQSAASGQSDISVLDVASNHHIGVKYGGGSALYGSSAIGGAIYLDSDVPQKEGMRGYGRFSAGSYVFSGYNIGLSMRKQDIAVAVGFQYQTSDNDFLFKNTAEIGQPLQRQVNAAFEKWNINTAIFFKINDKNNVKLNLWNSLNDRQIPPTMTSANDHARQEDNAQRVAFEWQHIGKRVVTKTRFGFFKDYLLYNSDAVDSSVVESRKMIGETELNIPLSATQELRFGVNYTYESAQIIKSYNRPRIAVFNNYRKRFKKLELSANMRQEVVDNQWINPTASIGFEYPIFFKKSKISPPFGGGGGLQLRGGISYNYNLPALNDLYWQNLGNPNLMPENGWSEEIGFNFNNKNIGLFKKLSLTVFNMHTKDWILWQPINGIWRPDNVEKIWSRGIETQTKWAYHFNEINIETTLQYQMTYSTDKNGNQILFTPLHSGAGGLNFNYKNYYIAYNQSFSGRRYMATDNLTWTNPFSLGNMTLGGVMTLWKLKGNYSLRINNIFNANYQPIRFYAMPRRNFMIQIGFSF